MGQLNTDVLAAKNGSSPTELVKQSAAKAYWRGLGDATLEESFNISSGTDNGTGSYTYSHTNNVSSAGDPVVSSRQGVGPVFIYFEGVRTDGCDIGIEDASQTRANVNHMQCRHGILA